MTGWPNRARGHDLEKLVFLRQVHSLVLGTRRSRHDDPKKDRVGIARVPCRRVSREGDPSGVGIGDENDQVS